MDDPNRGQATNAPARHPVDRHAGPVTSGERIVSLDVLRGVAVLGILFLNIQSFSMIGAAYMNPTAHMDLEGANYVVWHLTHLLGDQKFMTIFSMLFGAGIVLMTGRAEAAGRGSAGVHYRRMGWLILFGILHAHLLWYGDILYMYGMCGLLAWPLRKLPAAVLVAIGAVVLIAGGGNIMLYDFSMPYWGEPGIANAMQGWAPTPEQAAVEIEHWRGSWLTQMNQRVPTALMFQLFMLPFYGFGWKVAALIVLGMGLFKLRIFSAARSGRFYTTMAIVGLGAGLPIVQYGVLRHQADGWTIEYSMFQGSLYNYFASLAVSLGYVALVMLACRTPALAPALRPFAAAGRMALSNYLLQTIICTTLFYGHGFGLFGRVERTGQVAIVAAILVAQLIWSPIWLRYFRFGPFEWLWRSLTYWERQPMRRGRD
jgi:uncharacterized protein